MSCLTTAERAAIEADIVTKTEQLALANASLSAAITKKAKSYRFDSGEGAQQAVQRQIDEFTKLIAWLEGGIESLRRKLKCQGIVSMNMRRKGYGRGWCG